MVARTNNALAVANGPQLSGKHWLIESWYKSAVPCIWALLWVYGFVVVCVPLGVAISQLYHGLLWVYGFVPFL